MSLLERLYDRVVDTRTGSGWRIPALDGLRGVAASMVLIAHTRQAVVPNDSLAWAPIERGGAGGVILFFALSGFLLYLPWLRSTVESKPPPRFKHYAIRRCLRIMPAYYFSVLVLAVLRVVIGGKEPLDPLAITLHFLFLPTLMFPLQTVYWTLQVEEFFYWLLPALHWVVKKIGALNLVVLASLVATAWAAIGFALLQKSSMHLWLEETPFFLPAFALGIFTAVRWQKNGVSGLTLVIAGTVVYIAITPLALWATRAFDPAYITPITEVLMAPAASAVVLGTARGGARFLEHPLMRFLGAISFSMYLWHMVVIRFAPVPGFIAESFGLRTLYTFALTIPVALGSYLFVERPFLMRRPQTHTPT